MKKFYTIIFVSVIISIFVFLIIGIYRGGAILFGDTDLTYHFAERFFSFKNSFLWNDYFQSGIFDFNKFQGFYIKKLVYLIRLIVSSFNLFSYLWYFIPMFLFALSSFFFIGEFLKQYKLNKNRKLVIALTLSVFSFLNGIFLLYVGQALYLISLLLINIFLIFFFKNLYYFQKYNRLNYTYLVIMAVFLSEATIYLQNIILLLYALIVFALIKYRIVSKYYRQILLASALIFVIIILLNAPWLLVLLGQFLTKSSTVSGIVNYDVKLGLSLAESTSKNIFLQELFRLKSYHAFNREPLLVYFFGYIPMLIIIFNLTKTKIKDKNFLPLLVTFLLFLYISIGIQPINKSVFIFLWNEIPLFSTFRTIMKFHFVLLYTIVLMLAIILSQYKKRIYFMVSIALLLLFAVSTYGYYWQSEFRRNFQQYSIPDYYYTIKARNFDQTDKKLGNAILLPQTNWQYQYEWAPKKVDGVNVFPYFYGSGDLINGAQYEADPQFDYNDDFNVAFRTGTKENLNTLTSQKNIKYIIYQNDARIPDDETLSAALVDRPPLNEKPSLEYVLSLLSENVCAEREQIGEIYFCKVHNTVFMPAITVENNTDKYTAEFKKINPTKYRVIIHNIKSNFDLILAQNYNIDWEVSIDKHQNISQNSNKLSEQLSKYKIIEGNQGDQASIDELSAFVDEGVISTLGDGSEKKIEHKIWQNNKEVTAKVEKYNVEFVSKKIRGVIQNDNLPDGRIDQFFSLPPINNLNHVVTTSNYNKWSLDPDNLCNDSEKCKINPDGSYDLEMVLEFKPQRFLYLGLYIGGITFVVCIVYIIIGFFITLKNRMNSKVNLNG